MKRLSSLTMVAVATLAMMTSAQAIPIAYTASLDGASEAPPNTSPGSGTSRVVIDTTANTLRVTFEFTDLIGDTTAAHIHGPTATPGAGTAGVITALPFFPGFPTGVTSGSYDMTFDTTANATFSPNFISTVGSVAAAEAALADSLAAGTAYLNIHTGAFPGGEIRGFLQPAAVPEPASLGLMLAGTLGLLLAAGRRARR
ncbi:MAG: CHRD domain-containing protein [Candidatus Competibacteraceae bacterium]|nr:CHRD domain-containing protein [Candidatus Competibacteraceae bacterium]